MCVYMKYKKMNKFIKICIKYKKYIAMNYKVESTDYIINKSGDIIALNYKNRGKIKKMKQFNHKCKNICNRVY